MWILLSACAFSIPLIPSYSPRLMLRMYAATPIDPDQDPLLWAVLCTLSDRANLASRPRLYYIPSRVPNAFAMGSKQRSLIALSDALLQQLSLQELGGVIAHEISHIRHNDLWVMGLADLFSRTTMLLSLTGQLLLILSLPLLLLSDLAINWLALVLLIVAPFISLLAQQALSRTREFEADLHAARLTGDPKGLALALIKIEALATHGGNRSLIPGQPIPGPSALRTHPPTGERVTRLLRLRPELAPLGSSPDPNLYTAPYQRFARPVKRPRWHINGLWY